MNQTNEDVNKSTNNTDFDIQIRELPKRGRGRPSIVDERGVTAETVLKAYWTLRSVRKTAHALQISPTTAKKYIKMAGGADKSYTKYKQPYPWFRKGSGPVWKWISENKEVISNVRDLTKLALTSGIAEESLKKALTRRRAIATSYLHAHGTIQACKKNIKVMDLEGRWRALKYVDQYIIDVDRYSMGVRLKIIFTNGVISIVILTYQEMLSIVQAATSKKIELPQESVLVRTVIAEFPILNESTCVLPAAAIKK